MIEVSLVTVTTGTSPRKKACKGGVQCYSHRSKVCQHYMFSFQQCGFLHLPLSVKGLRRSKPRFQVSSPVNHKKIKKLFY